MTTRAGTSYNINMEDENGYRTEQLLEQGGVARELSSSEMLQLFLQERQRREVELVSERRRWEEEKQLREVELERERRRRDEEVRRREDQTQRQMEILQALVEGVQMQGEAATRRVEREKDVRVPKLTEEDDIVAYLTTFERLMVAYEVREERWAFKLAANLSGRAQQAYSSMNAADAGSYCKLKEAILQRYDITEESYRQRFRACKRKGGESNRELVSRIDDLASKWLKTCETVEEVRDRIVMEQFLNGLPEEVRIFIRERQPKTSEEAGRLADDHFQARKESRSVNRDKGGDKMKCLRCGKPGHQAKDCTVKLGQQEKRGSPAGTSEGPKPKRDLKDVECFNCHNKGHYSSHCPRNALFVTERRAVYQGESTMVKRQSHSQPGVLKRGVVEGKEVEDILLDTGCSRTLVHKDLVPESRIQQGEAVAIRCAHGDTVLYPLAEISLEVAGYPITVEAAVSATLPMSVLLGTDTPELAELLVGGSSKKESEEAFAVATRASTRKEQEENQKHRHENTCVLAPKPLEADSLVWMKELDEELFGVSKVRVKKTRKEKRQEKRERERLQEEDGEENPLEEEEMDNDDRHELDISSEELKVLQATDPTLGSVRIAVKTQELVEGVGFFRRDGLLYRRWIPPGRTGDEMALEQLILPRSCRNTVMKVAHSIPLAGHLGKDKTTSRVLQHFYWPTIYRDIARFCRTCESCQKVSGRKTVRAPLIPLPIIEEPFSRIAMDVIGPLPKSSSGNCYVLVVCDYATRYPEAVPMKNVDAASVAEELLKIFSRVGVPQEILTDQGTNFTSQLLVELYKMLHVQPIRTTPFHPQTDGLVERFNQTLKLMLKKAMVKEGKDWDKLLPYLLFAYREVPQASTGFSPFELLYGHRVRGPLDILSESWQCSERSKESVVSHVLSMRSKLEMMKDMAHTNLKNSQDRQKQWYDRNSRVREFQCGDLVLLLLPTSANKLLAKWQGPYRVKKRIGKVNYLIEMPDHCRKSTNVYHVNLLKKWEEASSTCGLAKEVSEEEFPDWRASEDVQPTIGSQLSEAERGELKEMLKEFDDVLQGKPGQTNLTRHAIHTDSSCPVRLPPYRIPHAYREAVAKELEEMEENGVIEPSCSEWSSPIVVVKKKDGSIRLCIDYRRLNSVTSTDAYPMPRTDELIDQLGKAKYITTIDLARGYWQVPMAEQDKGKTAFTTPKGLFQFKVMPFGLSGAPATFQRMMDDLIRGLESFTSAYIDDIIIFSETWEDHIKHVREVLERLRKGKLKAKAKKCQFGMRECHFLGHVVGNGSIRPNPEKIRAVEQFPKPSTKKQVRGFLGLTGYYRRFIEDYARIALPLTDLTKKSLPDKVKWTSECEDAFSTLKEVLCQSPILHNPDFAKTFFLQTDASDRGVGAVLSQLDDRKKDHPVAYYSRKLLPREERYSTVEKECLAIKLGVEAFRVYLLGRQFVIQTDHRSLIWLDRLKEKNARLTRWSLALQPYTYTVVHRAGSANGNADALSRAATDSSTAMSVAEEGGRSVKD